MSPRAWLVAMAIVAGGLFTATATESGSLPVPSARDAEILAACMNGRLIALDDGRVLTCHIGRIKR